MKRRFLLHSLYHTFLVVDITTIGLTETCSANDQNTVPFLQFQNWRDAEQYLRASGASAEVLETTSSWLRKTSVAVLTIT